MSKRRTGVQMQAQVKVLSNGGYTIRRIARITKLSRNTVRSILRERTVSEELESFPSLVEVNPQQTCDGIDWEKVIEQHHRGVTIKALHSDFGGSLTYNTFWYNLRKKVPTQAPVTMRLEHKVGEKIFFDFADGIPIYSRTSNTVTKTQLFIGVLPFSSFVQGEFVWNQKQPTLIKATERVFRRVGGVTPYAVFDNLRSAVAKAHIYDPDVNQTFVEFANYIGFAVLPARPYSPKDKASVECNIGVIQRQFYQSVRERKFYSLQELNEVFQKYLDELNSSPMKDHGNHSRNDRFSTEKPVLKPLSGVQYELSTWKTSKVHTDCHIQVEHRFYSVPFKWVGHSVRVKLRDTTIEVYSEQAEPIAIHSRLKAATRVSTDDSHYPPQKLAVARFEVKSAHKQAEMIGPKTALLVQDLLGGTQPLKYLRRVQGILRLKSTLSSKSIEYASDKAMLFNKKHYNYVLNTARFFESGGERLRSAPPVRRSDEVFLHQNNHP